MYRHLLASLNYGLLRTLGMPTNPEEHLRCTLDILPVPSASFGSWLFLIELGLVRVTRFTSSEQRFSREGADVSPVTF